MKCPASLSACLLTLSALAVPGFAAEDGPVIPRIDQRYVGKELPDETPDFRQHVNPLFGKLGCNSRSCHGSFQGQGGFRLSLFGYDFKLDHDNLFAGDEPRVNLEDPQASLMLRKPTMDEIHEGGKRMEKGGWEYQVFLKWIQAGGQSVTESTPDLIRVEVTPREIVFGQAGEQVQLKAVAIWDNGTREDVTPLCRFQVNNDQVAEITQDGLLTAKEPGDTHAVAFYDRAVISIPVIRPLDTPDYPQIAARTELDGHVLTKLRKLGVVPSEVCTDAEFLRRVSLDMTGSLPTAAEVRQFLTDGSPDKRARKVEELLASPAYAAWWTTKLCDYTGNNEYELRNISPVRNSRPSQDWYDWIYKRVAENQPYDKLVEGIVMAKGREQDETFAEYCRNMSEMYHGDGEKQPADCETMQYYWARRNLRQPEEKALAFAYSFLGIRIQCAQCHKHPFDQWSQHDFQEFSKFFTTISFNYRREDRDELQKMQKELGLEKLNGGDLRRALQRIAAKKTVVPFMELYTTKATATRNTRRTDNGSYALNGKATLLGAGEVDLTKFDDPRQPLMDWLRRQDNPLFARAFVNRVWSNYFNVGIVEPADDHSLANPPSNKPLLDYLSQGFIASGFDMKWLHREIALSDTYQRSWQANETNQLDERNFSRAVHRRLPAEVAYDALLYATASDDAAAKLDGDMKDRAISLASALQSGGNYRGSSYALAIFGRSARETNCECDRSAEPSLLQTVYLRNDSDLYGLIDRRDGWVRQVTDALKPATAQTPQKPDDYNREVNRYEQKLASLKKRGNKEKERVRELQAKLDAYKKRYQQPEQPVTAKPSADYTRLVEDAYLRTLSRFPTEEERGRVGEYLASAEDPQIALRSVLWALLNTKEFIVNH